MGQITAGLAMKHSVYTSRKMIIHRSNIERKPHIYRKSQF